MSGTPSHSAATQVADEAMSFVPAPIGLNAVAFVALAGTMAMMAFVAVIGPLTRLLGLSEWHAGLSITAAGALWMLSARRWGEYSDRVGRRRVLMIALACFTIICALLAVFVDRALENPPSVIVSVTVIVGARALIGLVYAAVPPSAAAHIADQVAPDRRTSAMARLGAANAIGMVVGPMIAGWIAIYDLSVVLYVATLLPLVSLLLVGWRLPDARRPASRTPAKTAVGWWDGRLRLPIYATFVTVISVTVTQVTIGFFAIDRLALSAADGARVAGFALTAVGGGLIVSQWSMTRLTWPPWRWLLLGALLASIGFAAVSLIVAQWQLFAAYAIAGVGMGLIRPALQAMAANAVEAHEQGAAAGLVASIQGIGMVVGPLAGTVLYRWSPSAPYLLVGVLLLGLAIAAWRHRVSSVGETS
ncbi:MFS transporter [Salinicola acroporae]|nr:MFS transporter [Salinicola acroporae]